MWSRKKLILICESLRVEKEMDCFTDSEFPSRALPMPQKQLSPQVHFSHFTNKKHDAKQLDNLPALLLQDQPGLQSLGHRLPARGGGGCLCCAFQTAPGCGCSGHVETLESPKLARAAAGRVLRPAGRRGRPDHQRSIALSGHHPTNDTCLLVGHPAF